LRLKALREERAGFAGLADHDPETVRLIERALGSLQTGETFSLDDADTAFEQAYRRCSEWTAHTSSLFVYGLRKPQSRPLDWTTVALPDSTQRLRQHRG
jgi:hypothetical protein